MSKSGERKLLVSERNPGHVSDLFEANDVLNMFADGVGRVFSGPAVTKIEFFRVVDVRPDGDQMVEEREVFLRLTIPTAAYLESSASALLAMGSSLNLMESSSTQMLDNIKAAMTRVQDVKL